MSTFLAVSAHPCETRAQQAGPPRGPCPFCAPSPKALSSLPSSLHGDPGAFSVSPAADGLFEGWKGPPKGPSAARDMGKALAPHSPLAPAPAPAVLPPPALSMKETFLVLSLHNKLRSKVQPPAANMQKLVSPPWRCSSVPPPPPWMSHPSPTPCPGMGEAAHGCYTVVR